VPETTTNRGFWKVVLPMFGVGIAIVVLIVALRPSVRRNAAILVESKLRAAAAAAANVRDAEGGLAAATPDRLNQDPPEGMEFKPADEASDEPLVVSVLATQEAWTGAAKADSGACYFIRLSAEGTQTGTIPGDDCTGRTASAARASGWPDV
jgi:hypothetical protein